MWLLPGITTVPPELLREVWLCAYLIVLHRRRDGHGRLDEAEVRSETCTRVRDCLPAFSEDEWGREKVMACYQRATDVALSLDMASLRRACWVVKGLPHCSLGIDPMSEE